MTKSAVFTLKLEPELRDDFMTETASEDRSASQVVRELMLEYVGRKRQAREYEQYLKQKVSIARESVRANRGYTNTEVEEMFAARRREAEEPLT